MSRRAHGLRAWLWQRLSALYMLIYLLYFGLWFSIAPPQSYPEWRDWVSGTAASLGIALFFGALLIHAWVGMRDVIIDYVPRLSLRLTLLALTGIGLAGLGLWVLKVLYALD